MACIRAVIFSCLALTTLSQALGTDDFPKFNISELELPEMPKSGFPSNPMSMFMSSLDGLDRSKRQSGSGTDEEETQGESPTLANCNTTQITSICLNCKQVLICTKNFGFIKKCVGSHQFCNGGSCSSQQPIDCTYN